jgi:serine/threonine protein kinase
MSGELVLGLLVGQGAFGVVRRAERRRREDGSLETVAVKEVKPINGQAGVPHNAVREIGLLRELRHPHIVNLLDVVISPEEQKVSLVLEWAEYDLLGVLDLHSRCESAANTRHLAVLPVSMIRAIMFQLLDATEYIHSQWAMHRDIKARPCSLELSTANLFFQAGQCAHLARRTHQAGRLWTRAFFSGAASAAD